MLNLFKENSIFKYYIILFIILSSAIDLLYGKDFNGLASTSNFAISSGNSTCTAPGFSNVANLTAFS